MIHCELFSSCSHMLSALQGTSGISQFRGFQKISLQSWGSSDVPGTSPLPPVISAMLLLKSVIASKMSLIKISSRKKMFSFYQEQCRIPLCRETPQRGRSGQWRQVRRPCPLYSCHGFLHRIYWNSLCSKTSIVCLRFKPMQNKTKYKTPCLDLVFLMSKY